MDDDRDIDNIDDLEPEDFGDNGVHGIGEIVAQMKTAVAIFERGAELQMRTHKETTRRLDRHSIEIHGPEAAAERLAQVQGMLTKMNGRIDGLSARLAVVETVVESIRYAVIAVLVLLAFNAVVGLVR